MLPTPREISFRALLLICFANGITWLTFLFGTVSSFIIWVALNDGAPQDFIVILLFILALGLFPAIPALKKIGLYKFGVLTTGTVLATEGTRLYLGSRTGRSSRLYCSTIGFTTLDGKQIEFQDYDTKRGKRRKRRKESPFQVGADVEVLYDPYHPKTAMRSSKIGAALRLTDQEVVVREKALSVVFFPFFTFIFVNIVGLVFYLS